MTGKSGSSVVVEDAEAALARAITAELRDFGDRVADVPAQPPV